MNILSWWRERSRQKKIMAIRTSLTGREIDFRSRGWGHNLQLIGDSCASWCTPPLEKGDVIITELGRFAVTWVRSCSGVDDMRIFTCVNVNKLAGRAEPEGKP